MCNFNCLIKTEIGKNKDNYLNFLSCVTAISFNSNGDGDGIYLNFKDKLIKSDKKLDLLKLSNEINNSNFILSHQRIATHGLTTRYTQPFKSSEFVFGHNGIMPSFSDGSYSDSYGFFMEFIKIFNKMKRVQGYTREENIIKAIKELLENKNVGSYSIFIYDKLSKTVYYFKNSLTDIHFYKSNKEKLLYFTTKENNTQFLKMYFIEDNFKEFKIKNNKIYKIAIKNKRILLSRIAKIQQKQEDIKTQFNKEKTSYYGCYGDFKQISDFNESYKYNFNKEKPLKSDMAIKKERLNIVNYNLDACKTCNKTTSNYSKRLNEFICEDCIKELRDYEIIGI